MKYRIRHIIFEAAQICNLSCLYCYNHWRREESEAKAYSFAENMKTLTRILKTIDFEHITFTGGEPFLADGLKELALRARLKRKSVSIITNGTIAKYEDFLILKKMGVSLFEVPLHSDKAEVHDKMTGRKGSFEKVMETIRDLKSSGADFCSIIVLTKLNIEGLEGTLEFAESLGINRIMLARFNIGGRGINNVETLMPSELQLKGAFKTANDFCRGRRVSITSNVCVPACIIEQKDYPHIAISHCSSNINLRPITISSKGDLRLCNHSPITAGNIYKESIEEIFNSKYARLWEESRPEFCVMCGRWQDCKGGCRAASEQMGKSVEFEDPIIEIYGKREVMQLMAVRKRL